MGRTIPTIRQNNNYLQNKNMGNMCYSEPTENYLSGSLSKKDENYLSGSLVKKEIVDIIKCDVCGARENIEKDGYIECGYCGTKLKKII